MSLPVPPPSYATLSAMITPAIFMTANGSLIISTSNRMSRIVDRIRVLNDQGDALCRGKSDVDFGPDRLAHVTDQLGRLERRSDLIRQALSMLYLAFSAFVGTSLTLAIDSLLGERQPMGPVATTMSVAGVSLLLASSLNMVREARLALASNRLEVRFHRELQARRVAGGGCGGVGEPS